MITADDVTSIIAECRALQGVEGPTGYDTEIIVDSVSFIWLQHALETRFAYRLEAPGSDALETWGSARAVHRHLAETSPERVAALA